MSMSVSTAEAGLLAAPWTGAEQDQTLEAAARSFYDQTKDLVQHGKHDHPTDRIVLDDVAAMLALELGAQDPSHRAASLSEYVKLPGSGDGFTITVSASGHETLNRDADGPGGVTTAPGASAVIAHYTSLLGHPPSQDELAGFLAGTMSGAALPGGPAAASTTVLSVTGSTGAVIATGTASTLLAEWQSLVARNDWITPNIDLPGQPPLQNATEAAACLLQLSLGAGTANAALVTGYNRSVATFDAVDQPMLAVAAHYEAMATGCDKNNADRVKLDQTAAKLALQIASEPEASRGSLSQTVQLAGHKTEVTVSQTSTDITGGAQFHDIDSTNLFSLIEQIGTAVLDAVAVVVPVLAPVAVAVNLAEAGESFAEGNILGGVLSLGSAVGIGLGGLASEASDLGIGSSEAGDLGTASRLVNEGTALVGGVSGAVQSGESGDGIGVLAGLLEAGGVAAGGLVQAGAVGGSAASALGNVASTAGFVSAGLGIGDGLAHGDIGAGLSGIVGTALPFALQSLGVGTTEVAGSATDDDAQDLAAMQADIAGPDPVVPVAEEDLPALPTAGTAAATVTTSTVSASAASVVATQAATTQAVVAGTSSALGSDAVMPDGPGGSDGQQAGTEQAAQVQAQQRAGADASAVLHGMDEADASPASGSVMVAQASTGTATDAPANLRPASSTAAASGGMADAQVNLGSLGTISGLLGGTSGGDGTGTTFNAAPAAGSSTTYTISTPGSGSSGTAGGDTSAGLGATLGLSNADAGSDGTGLPPLGLSDSGNSGGSGGGGGSSGSASGDTPAQTPLTATVTLPMLAAVPAAGTDAALAGGGAAAWSGAMAAAGEMAEGAALWAGETALGAVAAPFLALGAVLAPTSTASDDTLTARGIPIGGGTVNTTPTVNLGTITSPANYDSTIPAGDTTVRLGLSAFTPAATLPVNEGFSIADPSPALPGFDIAPQLPTILSTPANPVGPIQLPGFDIAPQQVANEGFTPAENTGTLIWASMVDDQSGDISQDWTKPTGWRLPATNGEWSGTPGNSDWTSYKDDVNVVTGGDPIPFKNGYPDFSQWSQGSYTIENLTGTSSDFGLVYDAVAAEFGLPNRTAGQTFLQELNLTPHHVEDGKTIELVPSDLNNNIPHLGGASILRKGG